MGHWANSKVSLSEDGNPTAKRLCLKLSYNTANMDWTVKYNKYTIEDRNTLIKVGKGSIGA